MTEGEKKKIYYDLRNNNVCKGKLYGYLCTTYTFGHYRIEDWYDYINISKAQENKPGVFVNIYGAEWDEDYPKNDVYAISVAVKNKLEGKEYTDPYKDIPTDVEIKNLTKYFGKQMLEKSDEFLPVYIPKYQALRTIVEMKQNLAQKLKQYYTK